MRIKDIPWWNKPGYKLKKNGEDTLDPAELLAIILEKGIKFNESSVELANKLLKKHKSLTGISRLSIRELEKEVGKVKALKIKAMFELFKENAKLEKNGHKTIIENAKDVYNIFADKLANEKRERFYVILLDSNNGVHKIIKQHLVSIGTLNHSLVHPREVFKWAVKESANAIIIVHNHPDEKEITVSEEDKLVTNRIKEASKIIGINLLDHIVISGSDYFSFGEKGLL